MFNRLAASRHQSKNIKIDMCKQEKLETALCRALQEYHLENNRTIESVENIGITSHTPKDIDMTSMDKWETVSGQATGRMATKNENGVLSAMSEIVFDAAVEYTNDEFRCIISRINVCMI